MAERKRRRENDNIETHIETCELRMRGNEIPRRAFNPQPVPRRNGFERRTHIRTPLHLYEHQRVFPARYNVNFPARRFIPHLQDFITLDL